MLLCYTSDVKLLICLAAGFSLGGCGYKDPEMEKARENLAITRARLLTIQEGIQMLPELDKEIKIALAEKARLEKRKRKLLKR